MPLAIVIVPIVLQAAAMAVDEGWYHRRRELPRWERIGHPLDTLTIAGCLAWLVATRPTMPGAPAVYIGLAIASCVFVTKDEAVHARLCSAGEHWLHAMLFLLHPVVLAAYAALWWADACTWLGVQLALTLAFLAYQVIRWNFVARRAPVIDNAWYGPLGARWYDADDTPIALLRAEARHRNPWIAETIAHELAGGPSSILDLGCGAGFLSNHLAALGHRVTGVDTIADNLVVAREHDRSRRATYILGDARALPFADGSFDVVCAMDLLEHVDDPARVIAEAARVLAPKGLFFFHTFNRTWMANLVVVKGVRWFVKNTPRDLHVLDMFLAPHEVTAMCGTHGLAVADLRGSRPRFRWPLWRMLVTGRVGNDFGFTFTPSTKLGYTGYAKKILRQGRVAGIDTA
jgi:2-polyprenyl-6-hydroxyphenyl methylase / 3-demethylubiquinone-9 3-methyltransferase